MADGIADHAWMMVESITMPDVQWRSDNTKTRQMPRIFQPKERDSLQCSKIATLIDILLGWISNMRLLVSRFS
jgi:hypothetical protein